jgi:hypothetical protein
MIARHSTTPNALELWAKISAPLPATAIEWRQDGKPITRDGKYFARFVPYVSAQYVRERLDMVVPGEWDYHLEVLPPAGDSDGVAVLAFKARLQILGVIREDVGQGSDYKAAATDAFKRVAMRFGIAAELYAAQPCWVQVESESKYAKPLEDPTAAYVRKYGGLPGAHAAPHVAPAPDRQAAPRTAAKPAASKPAATPASKPAATPAEDPTLSAARDMFDLEDVPGEEPAPTPLADEPACPKCGGRMWDNRLSKRNPKAPDYKCQDRACDGVIWPPKDGNGPRRAPAPEPAPTLPPAEDDGFLDALAAGVEADDGLPF